MAYVINEDLLQFQGKRSGMVSRYEVDVADQFELCEFDSYFHILYAK